MPDEVKSKSKSGEARAGQVKAGQTSINAGTIAETANWTKEGARTNLTWQRVASGIYMSQE